MKLPKNIKVVCGDYKVIPMSKEEAAKSEFFGLCRNNEQEVRIDTAWGNQTIARTLLHELIHAVFFQMGMRNFCSKKMEERIIEPLANGLLCVIKDNPKLFPLLQKYCK